MQLHSTKIISSFLYILWWIGQTLKTFRTWICLNLGQLEKLEFSKIQINPLEKLVSFPSAFLESFTHRLLLNIFLLTHFSLFLYFIASRTLRSSSDCFGDNHPTGGDTCSERYASKALGWLCIFNMDSLGGLAPRASGTGKYLHKSCFIAFTPQEMKPTTPKDMDRAVLVMYYDCLPRQGSRPQRVLQGLSRNRLQRILSYIQCFFVHGRRQGKWERRWRWRKPGESWLPVWPGTGPRVKEAY